jgi:predicted Kef-type K+ transport protein
LSKSDTYKLFCIGLYFSNSFSAKALAISAVIFQVSFNISFSLNFKNVFSLFDQSFIVMGIHLSA